LKPNLSGSEVVFTGRLAAMTHEQAAETVRKCGGAVTGAVGPGTDCLVIGQEGWPFRRDGRLTRNLVEAKRLVDDGQALEIIDEETFLERVGLGGGTGTDLGRLYSITQLSRILDVPAPSVRAWVRRGLIRPRQVRARVAYFDFVQVAAAKHLKALIDDGVPVETIASSLKEVRRWMPRTQEALSQLTILEGEKRLVVRLSGGGLAAVSGQLRLPWASASPEDAKLVRIDGNLMGDPDTPEGWFERAVAFEEAERLEDAAHAYNRCLELGGPDAEAAFNLGNVLFSLGRPAQALRHLYQATDWDPDFAEAWVNLASVLVELGAWKDAAVAARTGLRIAPGYADAHYNLALALHGLGEARDARLHARAYLLQDPSSEWANLLRRQLGLA
jgi:tetratricopeptide (TPR) repeat protein